MEELKNENQSAPKVEKISLAELRAEAAKLNELENRYYEQQKQLEEELKEKKNLKEKEEADKAFDAFLTTLENSSPKVIEEFTRLLENGELDD